MAFYRRRKADYNETGNFVSFTGYSVDKFSGRKRRGGGGGLAVIIMRKAGEETGPIVILWESL